MSDESKEVLSRRHLLRVGLVTSAATLLPGGGEFFTVPLADAQGEEPLPSWNNGASKKAIVDFVSATTDRSSSRFIPPEQRIAAFDQDGTFGSSTRFTARLSIVWIASRRSSRPSRNWPMWNPSRQ